MSVDNGGRLVRMLAVTRGSANEEYELLDYHGNRLYIGEREDCLAKGRDMSLEEAKVRWRVKLQAAGRKLRLSHDCVDLPDTR